MRITILPELNSKMMVGVFFWRLHRQKTPPHLIFVIALGIYWQLKLYDHNDMGGGFIEETTLMFRLSK